MFFDVDERDFVFEAQLHDSFAESVGDVQAFLRFDGVKKVENGFAGGSEIAGDRGVALLEDDMPAGNDHHRLGLMRSKKGTQSFKTS